MPEHHDLLLRHIPDSVDDKFEDFYEVSKGKKRGLAELESKKHASVFVIHRRSRHFRDYRVHLRQLGLLKK